MTFRQPLPNEVVDGGIVVASVVYSDVPVEGSPDPRFEVTMLRLLPEAPYFHVGIWDCRTNEPVLLAGERHHNIVPALEDYMQNGGDF